MGFKSPLHGAGFHQTQSFEVIRTISLSIANDTDVEIDFDFLNFDGLSQGQTNPLWAIGDPTNVNIAQRGLFLLEAFVEFTASAVGYRYVAIKQGAGVWRETRLAATPTLGTIIAISAQKLKTSSSNMAAGIRVRQTSGGPLSVIVPTFTVTKIARG